jgi:hypothetical protein
MSSLPRTFYKSSSLFLLFCSLEITRTCNKHKNPSNKLELGPDCIDDSPRCRGCKDEINTTKTGILTSQSKPMVQPNDILIWGHWCTHKGFGLGACRKRDGGGRRLAKLEASSTNCNFGKMLCFVKYRELVEATCLGVWFGLLLLHSTLPRPAKSTKYYYWPIQHKQHGVKSHHPLAPRR